MNEELLNLFLLALQGNKNVSTTLNNLMSPELVYLSGQYNPLAAMGNAGGTGPLTAKYSNAEKYPAVSQILNQINTGADEFELSTFVKGLIANNQTDNFDSYSLENLAKELYKESKGGGEEKKTDWQKAGLNDPIDIYSEENLPNKPVLNSYLQSFMGRQMAQSEELKRLSENAESKRKAVAPLYDKEFTTEDLLRYLRDDPEGRRLAKERNIDMSKVDDEGSVYTWRGTQNLKKRPFFDPRNITEGIEQGLSRFGEDLVNTVKGGQTKTIEEAVGGTGKIIKGQDAKKKAYEDASSKAKQVEDQMKLDKYQTEKYIKAYLGEIQKRGITPLDDQFKGVMGFLSQNR